MAVNKHLFRHGRPTVIFIWKRPRGKCGEGEAEENGEGEGGGGKRVEML